MFYSQRYYVKGGIEIITSTTPVPIIDDRVLQMVNRDTRLDCGKYRGGYPQYVRIVQVGE